MHTIGHEAIAAQSLSRGSRDVIQVFQTYEETAVERVGYMISGKQVPAGMLNSDYNSV
jgi:hypothetical protein